MTQTPRQSTRSQQLWKSNLQLIWIPRFSCFKCVLSYCLAQLDTVDNDQAPVHKNIVIHVALAIVLWRNLKWLKIIYSCFQFHVDNKLNYNSSRSSPNNWLLKRMPLQRFVPQDVQGVDTDATMLKEISLLLQVKKIIVKRNMLLQALMLSRAVFVTTAPVKNSMPNAK